MQGAGNLKPGRDMMPQGPHGMFQDYLARKRLKMTPQRRVILDVFLEEDEHLSSEELYAKVKKVDPSIGQATVYRTMKLLADAGFAGSVDFNDGVRRYEHKLGQAHHDHLICESCRKNIEVVDPEIERLQEHLARRHGFLLTHHRMYLYGLCPDCRGTVPD